MPSLESILQNLEDSLQAMEATRQEKFRRKIDEKTRASFRIVLFIARISTSISKMIADNIGQDFLEQSLMISRGRTIDLGKPLGYFAIV